MTSTQAKILIDLLETHWTDACDAAEDYGHGIHELQQLKGMLKTAAECPSVPAGYCFLILNNGHYLKDPETGCSMLIEEWAFDQQPITFKTENHDQ